MIPSSSCSATYSIPLLFPRSRIRRPMPMFFLNAVISRASRVSTITPPALCVRFTATANRSPVLNRDSRKPMTIRSVSPRRIGSNILEDGGCTPAPAPKPSGGGLERILFPFLLKRWIRKIELAFASTAKSELVNTPALSIRAI